MWNKNILIITPWYIESLTGGVAIAVKNLVHCLHAEGSKPVVLVPIGRGLLPRFERGNVGELILYIPARHLNGRISSLRQFLAYYSRFFVMATCIFFLTFFCKCRAAHFHYCLKEYDVLCRILSFYKIPFITTFHGSEVTYGFTTLGLGTVMERIVHDANYVITVSDSLLNDLRRHLPHLNEKGLTIVNAVSLDIWQKGYHLEPQPLKDIDVLFVGSLRPEKGADLLPTLFERLIKTMPGLSAVLIGSGPLSNQINQQLIKSRISNRVHLLGNIPHDEIYRFYNRAKLVVMPSRSEGFGLVALEAALFQKPVVATAVGGLPEVVLHNKTGMLVTPGDVDSLEESILFLLNNDSRAEEMGFQARQTALRPFNPHKMVAKYIAIYEKISNSKKASDPKSIPV